MKPLTITDATFDQEVNKSPSLTIVDFWAPWCAPCRLLEPVLHDIAAQYEGELKVTKLNVDNNPITAQAFRITSIPTLLFIKNGSILDRVVGALPKNMLERRIQLLLSEELVPFLKSNLVFLRPHPVPLLKGEGTKSLPLLGEG